MDRGTPDPLAIHLVVAADIKQHDLFFKYRQGKRYAKAVGQADRITALKPPLERVQLQVRCEGVILQIGDKSGEPGLEIGMGLEEPAGLSKEPLRRDDAEHYSSSPASIVFKSAAAVLNFLTLPALTSLSDSFTPA